ncbi:MAG: hypothetical protein WDN08_01680 [Rhizomicrobium sp.]
MDRRNFFALASAAGVAMAGIAAESAAAGPTSGKEFLRRFSAGIAGSPLDTDLLTIAVSASRSLDSAFLRRLKLRLVFGPACGLIIPDLGDVRWISIEKAFGAEVRGLPLSKLLDVASRSRFATENFGLKVDRDGEILVSR